MALGPAAQARMEPKLRFLTSGIASRKACRSDGLPSVIKNTSGRQSPFVSGVDFLTSRSTQAFNKSSAAPMKVAPELGISMPLKRTWSSGVSGMNTWASVSKVMMARCTLSSA